MYILGGCEFLYEYHNRYTCMVSVINSFVRAMSIGNEEAMSFFPGDQILDTFQPLALKFYPHHKS